MKQFEKNTQFWLRPLSLPNGIPIVFVPLSQLQPPLTLDSLTQPSAFIASTSSTQRISSQFSFSLELNYGIFYLLKYMCKYMHMNSFHCPRNIYLDIYIYIYIYIGTTVLIAQTYLEQQCLVLQTKPKQHKNIIQRVGKQFWCSQELWLGLRSWCPNKEE